MSSIHDVDLDRLRVLCEIHRQRSVSRAARRLGLTQSAVSHSLGRLREQLGDPLFVRSGRGMEPTPYADALVRTVEPHLRAVADALSDVGSFEPARSRRVFRLASIDLLDRVLLPRILACLGREAPGLKVEVRAQDEGSLDRFRRGELDAAVHPVLEGAGEELHPGAGFRQTTLFREGFAMFSPADLEPPTTLDTFCDARHLLVGPSGGPGIVDRVLAQQGRRRQVVAQLTRFAGALDVVRRAGLVLVGPVSLRRVLPEGVVASPAPLDLPEIRVTLLWPDRLDDDPGHRWFRRRLMALARDRSDALDAPGATR